MRKPIKWSFGYRAAALVFAAFALLAANAWRQTMSANEAVATEGEAALSASSNRDVNSPFVPWVDDDTADGAALLGGVRLVGVRMSADPARSGAIFVVAEEDGERPFVVGQDIVAGVRLRAVAADHVLVDVRGGATFALALEGGEASAVTNVPQPQSTPAPPSAIPNTQMPSARDWLIDTIARPEESLGPSPGWRVRPPLSEAASTAGLQVGDLILSINGAPPSAADAAAAAARLDMIQLSVLRSDGSRLTVWYAAN